MSPANVKRVEFLQQFIAILIVVGMLIGFFLKCVFI